MTPAILASHAFAIRDWYRVPSDLESRLSRMMRQSVPSELRPKRFRSTATTSAMNVNGLHAARNRGILEMSRKGMSSTKISEVFGLDERHVRRILQMMREHEAKA